MRWPAKNAGGWYLQHVNQGNYLGSILQLTPSASYILKCFIAKHSCITGNDVNLVAQSYSSSSSSLQDLMVVGWARYNSTTYMRYAMRWLNAPHLLHPKWKMFLDGKMRATSRDLYMPRCHSFTIFHISSRCLTFCISSAGFHKCRAHVYTKGSLLFFHAFCSLRLILGLKE